MCFILHGTETTLSVTDRDIARGRRRSAGNCPTALAGRRLFPGMEVTVSPDRRRGRWIMRARRPRRRRAEAVAIFSVSAGKRIAEYDAGEKMRPCRMRVLLRRAQRLSQFQQMRAA